MTFSFDALPPSHVPAKKRSAFATPLIRLIETNRQQTIATSVTVNAAMFM